MLIIHDHTHSNGLKFKIRQFEIFFHMERTVPLSTCLMKSKKMLELLRSGVIMESENVIFSGFRFFPGTLHDQVILRFHASAVFRRC